MLKNKNYIVLSFFPAIIIFFSLVFIYQYAPKSINDAINYEGEEKEKIRVKQEFLEQLSSKEKLTEESIQNISGIYDSKTNDYNVSVIYKDEPYVIYYYFKKTDGESDRYIFPVCFFVHIPV